MLPESPVPDNGPIDRDATWQAIRALPPRQRAVVVLRYYEDLTESEIAEVLGISRGTVKSQAHDALHTLRTRLPDYDVRDIRSDDTHHKGVS